MDGQGLRIYNISRQLTEHHEMYYLGLTDTQQSPYGQEQAQENGIFSEVWYETINRKIYRHIFELISPQHAAYLGFPFLRKRIRDFVLSVIHEKGIDILHVSGFPATLLLADLRGIPRVLDLCDSPTLSCKRELGTYCRTLSLKKSIRFFAYMKAQRIEKYLVENYDLTTLISPVDAAYTERLCGDKNLTVIPNGVDTSYFSCDPFAPGEHPSLVFFGSMNFPPNSDAAFYLCRQILPEIRKEFPGVRVYIVGRNPPPNILQLGEDQMIMVTGSVRDVRPYVERSSVVVIPMRIGGGFKNKVVEAMSMGKPVVTTKLGTEALDISVEKHLLVGSDAMDFAEKVKKLLRDEPLRKNMGLGAKKFVDQMYSWSSCAGRYEQIYQKLVETSRG